MAVARRVAKIDIINDALRNAAEVMLRKTMRLKPLPRHSRLPEAYDNPTLLLIGGECFRVLWSHMSPDYTAATYIVQEAKRGAKPQQIEVSL